MNAVGDIRWNAAFAYLDPSRQRPNLTLVPDALVDRLRLDGERATGAIVRVESGNVEITADLVVLAAGAYCSPSILLRSGIGPTHELEEISVEPQRELPGVGRNLIDHPRVEVTYRPTASLLADTRSHLASGPARAQSLIKARSGVCPPGTWDLHIMMRLRRSLTADPAHLPDDPLAHLYVHAMKPASRGRVRLRSRAPDDLPIVDHGFLSDPAGQDAATLTSGIEIARTLARSRTMEEFLTDEITPGAGSGIEELTAYVTGSVGGYWHPVGTCKMGPSNEDGSVVDASGRLHGFANVYIADASILPTIPRSNTQLPVMAVAERIADLLRAR